MNDSTKETIIDGFINIRGMTLLVVDHSGIKYVQVKPLSDMVGVDWKGAKRALSTPDSVDLLGVCRLTVPCFAGQGGASSPQNDVLHIQLDRVYGYLMRINTSMIRAQGNEKAADWLLSLQKEWANVLHNYEIHGIAVKDSKRKDLARDQKAMMDLMKTRELAKGRERVAIDMMVQEHFQYLGFPLDDLETNQPDLFGEKA